MVVAPSGGCLFRSVTRVPEIKYASFNQERHFTSAVTARQENAPEKYWLGITFRIAGRPDLLAPEAAFCCFIQRHEVLRWGFQRLSGDLRCDVIRPEDTILKCVDVDHFTSMSEIRSYLEQRFGDFLPKIPLEFGVDYGRRHPAANETMRLLDDTQATIFERKIQASGAKFFMGLLAAVGIALRDVSGLEVYRSLMPIGERKEDPWTNSFGWFVNTMPIEFSVARDKDFTEILAEARTSFGELIKNLEIPFVKAWELLAPDYYALRAWPFPVKFFSFIDYRKTPGAENHDRWRPTAIIQASHINSGNMWFFRNFDGVYVNTIFSDTAAGRQSMGEYRDAIRGVLKDKDMVTFEGVSRHPAATVG